MVEIIEKVCPNCGGDMFMAAITRGGLVQVIAGENGEKDSFQIMRESKDKYDIVIGKCARCKADISAEDLVAGVKCTKCGNQVNPADINEKGMCGVCVALEERNELANASKEDLIRMLIEAEKRCNPVTTAQNKKGVANNAPQAPDVAVEDKLEEVVQTRTPRKKAVKRATKADAKDVKPEEVSEDNEEYATEDNEESDVQDDAETKAEVDNIANQQDAPFPNIMPESNDLGDILPGFSSSEAPPQQAEEPEESEEPEEEVKFRMFDNQEDAI